MGVNRFYKSAVIAFLILIGASFSIILVLSFEERQHFVYDILLFEVLCHFVEKFKERYHSLTTEVFICLKKPF